MNYKTFVASFKSTMSWLKNTVFFVENGDEIRITRRSSGKDYSTNLRLLYRIASRETMKEAVNYFLSDEFLADAEDKSNFAVKATPVYAVSAA